MVEIQIFESRENFTAKLSGKLMFEDRADFNALMGEMENIISSRFILDLDDLESIDSAGLGMIMIANDKIVDAGKKFSVINAKKQVRKVLEITDLGKIMHIEFAD